MWNQLIYGERIFVDREVKDGSMAREQDLTSASLSADSLSATVRTSDPTITTFDKNAPLTYIHRGTQRGIYYLQSITRVSPTHYTLYGLTAMGLLSTQIHPGGIYTGQTVQEIVASICGPVPVIVNERMASIRLYGWLPYAKPPQRSARDNLAEVLFAAPEQTWTAYCALSLCGTAFPLLSHPAGCTRAAARSTARRSVRSS